MKKFSFLFIFIFISLFAFGQSEWEIRNPYPTTNSLKGGFFLSDQAGWIVGYNGTILHTADGGVSWEKQHSDNTESMWNIFFIDDNEGWAVGWSDIYHTTDAGQNWEKQIKPSWPGDMTDVYFINHDTGWIVGTYKIVFKTTDGGDNWQRIMSSINQDKGFYSVAFTDELHGCAVGGSITNGNEGFIMKTDDGGLSWTETTPEENARYNKITFLNDTTAWVCGENGELLKTIDGGSTWTHHNINYAYFNDIHFFDEQRGVALMYTSIIQTADGGETWGDPIDIDNYHLFSLRALASGADNHLVAVGFDGYITKSVDGGNTWEKVSKGPTQSISQIGFFNESDGFAVTTSSMLGSLLRSSDGGKTWDYDTTIENGPFYKMQVLGDNSCFLLSTTGQMVKTVDGANTWSVSNVPDVTVRYADMQFADNQTGYMCADSSVLVKSIDGGESWDQIDFTENYHFSNLFFVDANHGWLVDWDGKQILETSDGGINWETSTLEADGLVYQPIDIFFKDENVGFASTKEGVLFKSLDGGSTWEKSYVFEESSISGKIYFTSDQEGWYLSMNTVWHTSDGGITWTNPTTFEVHLYNFYFLNDGRGWITGQSGLVAWNGSFVNIDEVKDSRATFVLTPNPATDFVTINLTNNTASIRSVKVVNMLGQQVITTGKLNIKSSYQLNVSTLQSGTYIIKVSTSGGEQFEKLVIQ